MIDLGNETNGRWLEGILGGEFNLELKETPGVRCIIRPNHAALPIVQVILVDAHGTVAERVVFKGGMFLYRKTRDEGTE